MPSRIMAQYAECFSIDWNVNGRVEQVDVVHQRDLLQPLARVVVPVRQPVDDQLVAGLVAQVERLDASPARCAASGCPPSASRRTPSRRASASKARGPVLLGAEQQPDRGAPGSHGGGHAVLLRRTAVGGARAGVATTASRGRSRGPTRRARGECPCPATGRRTAGSTAAPRSGGSPTHPARTTSSTDSRGAQPGQVVALQAAARSRWGWRSTSRRRARPSRATSPTS